MRRGPDASRLGFTCFVFCQQIQCLSFICRFMPRSSCVLLSNVVFPGFYELNEAKSPKRRVHSAEPMETGSCWPNNRPKSVGK